MPYHKNKQQSFQAAQQGTSAAADAFRSASQEEADYGAQVKQVKEEVNEAFAQIQNARENATGNQNMRLDQFEEELNQIVSEVDKEY